jgi:hypothetical protein
MSYKLFGLIWMFVFLLAPGSNNFGLIRGQQVDDLHGTVGTPSLPTAHRRKFPRKRTAANPIDLLIVSKPANCSVYIDEEFEGQTDADGNLRVSLLPLPDYKIRVSREGYIAREALIAVSMTPGSQQIEFTLAAALVTLNVVTDPPGAEVYLDDVYKGVTGPNGLLVLENVNPTQLHTLRVRKDGYVHQSTPVTSYAGQMSIKLLPDAIMLKVTTDPPETEVYLDEVYKGTSTSAGTLVVEHVNPNQSHTLRAKKDGYRQQSSALAPTVSESTITLSPDPIVLLIRGIKLQVAENRLPDAVASFNQLVKDAPDHQELPRLSEAILLALQSRTAEVLKRFDPFGLAMSFTDADEMNNLYVATHTWRPGDEAIDNFSKYWLGRLTLMKADRAGSQAEKDNLQRSARLLLSELSERNLRNTYLSLDLGWSWWRLNDKPAAQKQFKIAQESKPDWAYPYFALGFLSMNAADNERSKSARLAGYAQALENLIKAINLKHDFATAYALKSIIYSQLKQDQESIANGLQAVAVDPQNAYAHFALGFAYFDKGKSQYRNSLNELNRAMALGGSDLDEAVKSAIQLRLTRIKKTLK